MDQNFGRDVIFSRMVGILSREDLDRLGASTVAVPGCGGAGFTHAESLARMGIGRIKIADFDTFSADNIGRQFGATIHTVGKSKVEVLAERLTSINPALVVETFDGVTIDSIERFLDGTDIICDAIDYFAIASRRLMYREARRHSIPVTIAGPVGFGATLHIFEASGMSFDDYFDLRDGQSDDDMLMNFNIGLNPAQLYRYSLDDQKLDFKARSGSVLSSTCLLCTALVGIVALTRLIDKSTALNPVPHIYQLDLAAGKFAELHVPGGVKAIKADPNAYRR